MLIALCSPDGKYVAAGSAGDTEESMEEKWFISHVYYVLDGSLHIWNAKTGKLERALAEHR